MSTAICKWSSIVIRYCSISTSVMSSGSPSAKKMVQPGILYAMYWMISRAGDVWILVGSGSGKLIASGVCPIGRVCGVRAAGVMRLSGTSWRDGVGFVVESLGLGASCGVGCGRSGCECGGVGGAGSV